MDEARQIFLIFMYVIGATCIISVFAVGMGYTGLGDAGQVMAGNVTVPGGDVTSMTSSLLQTMVLVLCWTIPPEIFPWYANVFLIKLPLIYLVLSFIELVLP